VIIALRPNTEEAPVALFALKLVHETDDGSPIVRDDPVMATYEREVFGLLMRQGDLRAIQTKLDECVAQALVALGGKETVLGRELERLAVDTRKASTLEELDAPLDALRHYLKAVQ
jgi:F420-dependent methylenetetrahydromethanopterin dehydrogenase